MRFVSGSIQWLISLCLSWDQKLSSIGEARVWERGVGETLACGSGACAVTVAAQLHGYIGNRVGIKLPGGILNVEWDGVGEVLLSGSAEVVFTGEWLGEV